MKINKYNLIKEKRFKLIILIIAITAVSIVYLSGCINSPEEQINGKPIGTIEAGEIAEKGDVVEVDYIVKFENGTVFEKSGKPLKFNLGEGQVIKCFDEAVVGMKVGETKITLIPPEKAYGGIKKLPVIENIQLPLSQEKMEDQMNMNITDIHMQRPWPTEVISIDKTTIKIKNNPTPNTEYSPTLKIFEVSETEITYGHPLAGKTLIFEITLISKK